MEPPRVGRFIHESSPSAVRIDSPKLRCVADYHNNPGSPVDVFERAAERAEADVYPSLRAKPDLSGPFAIKC